MSDEIKEVVDGIGKAFEENSAEKDSRVKLEANDLNREEPVTVEALAGPQLHGSVPRLTARRSCVPGMAGAGLVMPTYSTACEDLVWRNCLAARHSLSAGGKGANGSRSTAAEAISIVTVVRV